MFADQEFEAACQELIQPTKEEGYELFTESHGTTIYRLYNKESGLYQYKTYGGLPDVNPEICSKVYLDIAYRKKWDSYVNELHEIEEGTKRGIYWQLNFPFFMSNRDYTYMREFREMDYKGQRMYVVLMKSEKFACEPERSGVIRVDDYIQSCALTSDGLHGTKAFMRYYDNPKGSIPTWIINWGAKTGVPGFLTDMEKACRGYPDYLSSLPSV